MSEENYVIIGFVVFITFLMWWFLFGSNIARSTRELNKLNKIISACLAKEETKEMTLAILTDTQWKYHADKVALYIDMYKLELSLKKHE